MAKPTTRLELKEYCLRRLGAPVIEINVADEQVEDRIDDALSYFHDYHYDGAERKFLAHKVTQTDIDNKYITIDDSIIGVIRVFEPTERNVKNMFDVKYQMRLNDAYWITAGNFQHYFMTMQNLAEAEQLFSNSKPMRFQRHTNQIHVDMDWSEVAIDQYLMFEVYQIIDPTVYADVYGDRFVRDYSTALIKKQWGENLSKFEGVQLPGGLTLNGQRIFQEATDEIRKLEEELLNNSAGIVLDMIG